ncbi:MAG: nucleotidyl transferase AbiEii/AbiGii toxin family protein [Candidatus Bathyarchaeia archaeon]
MTGVMTLMHDGKAFSKESVVANASKFGFVNPHAVELFLWDIELAAQLQACSNDVVLKGGAAAQLFIPVERQRGSRDVDLSTDLDPKALEELTKQLGSQMRQVKFEYYKPNSPKPNLNLITYYAETNSVTQPQPVRVKIDFLLHDLRLPTTEVRDVETFAVRTCNLRCFTPEVLVGDKILTLAKESIGLKETADYPKQIYDLSMLVTSPQFHNFEEVTTAIEKITPVEAKIAGCKVDHTEALEHVIRFVDGVLAPIDTSQGSQEMKTGVKSFEQFFAPASQKVTLQEWSARALRIGFVARLAQQRLKGILSSQDCESLLAKAGSLESRLGNMKGNEIEQVRTRLLSLQKTPLSYPRGELRGKSLRRVLWQVVYPHNLDQIDRLC